MYISQNSCNIVTKMHYIQGQRINKTAISAHTRNTKCSITFNKTNAPEYIYHS